MDEPLSTTVIIVGAGIAGLAAAWQLNQFGINTVVLEAEHIVGGRMKTIQLGNALVDCGAQFLSSAYTIIPKLIDEVELSNNLIAVNESVGIVRKNQELVVFNPRKPWGLFSSHVLSIWELLFLAFKQLKLFGLKKQISVPLNDITSWLQYDAQSASEWMIKNFGKSVAYELSATIFNGLYFQSLNDSSAAMAAAVATFYAYKSQTIALATGMGSLPQKLADRLNVKLGARVLAINETPTYIEAISSIGIFRAKHIILATPAATAKNIVQNPDPEMLALFDTSYSSSITISLLTTSSWTPPSTISSIYGFLFNPQGNNKVAALTIENNKLATQSECGYLINAMLSDKWAKKMLILTDEEIYREIKSDIEMIFPDLYIHVDTKNVSRWQYAMPCIPVGHAARVQQYRDSRKINNKLWLAGDYLGLPWTDSAAQTGIWAANQVLLR